MGLAIGLGFGIVRFCKGEIAKGIMEIASGGSSCFPGFGTVVSISIDSALIGHDICELKNSDQD